MALDKIMPDDMNEVACAMLAYIGDEDKQAGAKMSYGDFGKLLAEDYGKSPHGVSGPDECSIEATRKSIRITTLSGNEYELTWNKAAKFIHPYLKSTTVSETVETNTPTAVTDTPTDTTTFDYSAVDDDTAQYLRKATARIANSYADIGAVLAEAQERLANNYHGIFEKWYTSIGMKRDTVYGFIRIHNFRNDLMMSSEFRRTSENALEIFDNLPKTLQADISSPSAPAEAVNAVLSGDITTHKDFIAMKKQLEEARAENELLAEKNSYLSMDYTHEKERNERMLDELKEFREKSDALEVKLRQAQSEAREVIVTDPTESEEYKALQKKCTHLENELLAVPSPKVNYDEVDRRVTEAVDKMNHEYQLKFSEQQKNLAQMTQEKNERIYELQDKIKELEQKQTLTGYFLPVSIEDYSAICKLLKGTKYEKMIYSAKLVKF
jgi:hypothetical protein